MAPLKQLLTPGSPQAHPGSGASRARSGRPHPRPGGEGELDADFTFLGKHFMFTNFDTLLFPDISNLFDVQSRHSIRDGRIL